MEIYKVTILTNMANIFVVNSHKKHEKLKLLNDIKFSNGGVLGEREVRASAATLFYDVFSSIAKYCHKVVRLPYHD